MVLEVVTRSSGPILPKPVILEKSKIFSQTVISPVNETRLYQQAHVWRLYPTCPLSHRLFAKIPESRLRIRLNPQVRLKSLVLKNAMSAKPISCVMA